MRTRDWRNQKIDIPEDVQKERKKAAGRRFILWVPKNDLGSEYWWWKGEYIFALKWYKEKGEADAVVSLQKMEKVPQEETKKQKPKKKPMWRLKIKRDEAEQEEEASKAEEEKEEGEPTTEEEKKKVESEPNGINS